MFKHDKKLKPVVFDPEDPTPKEIMTEKERTEAILFPKRAVKENQKPALIEVGTPWEDDEELKLSILN